MSLDPYAYISHYGYYVCCGCSLTTTPHFQTQNYDKFKKHVDRHKELGQDVRYSELLSERAQAYES